MLTLSQIEEQYEERLRPFKRSMFREYLQYKILELMFAAPNAAKLSFLGGTALRIVHGNTRFSEDLDFDNFGLTDGEFRGIAEHVRAGLVAQGLTTNIDFTGKTAYRCNIRLPGVLYDNGLSPYENERILVQIDSLAHGITYAPELRLLNKFDVFTEVPVTPPDLLLAQKFYAAVNRSRAKGRDFFDIVFLCARTTPNYMYLADKLHVADAESLRRRILEKTADYDLEALALDVQPFLFDPNDARKVRRFREFIAQVALA